MNERMHLDATACGKRSKAESRSTVSMYSRDLRTGSIRELLMLARQNSLVVSEVPRSKLDSMCAGLGPGERPGNHQGIVAQAPAFRYSELEDIFELAQVRGEQPFILILENVRIRIILAR